MGWLKRRTILVDNPAWTLNFFPRDTRRTVSPYFSNPQKNKRGQTNEGKGCSRTISMSFFSPQKRKGGDCPATESRFYIRPKLRGGEAGSDAWLGGSWARPQSLPLRRSKRDTALLSFWGQRLGGVIARNNCRTLRISLFRGTHIVADLYPLTLVFSPVGANFILLHTGLDPGKVTLLWNDVFVNLACIT